MDFTVENAGTTIACREYAGPDVSPDTPALVCVHGACVDGTFFDGIACELGRNYRVIAYDRRGCGGSSEAADGSYDLAAQAADLQAVIEHVGAPTNVLRTAPVRWWRWSFFAPNPISSPVRFCMSRLCRPKASAWAQLRFCSI
ncbi:MAG: alpha/beta fold hydrolase [Collinsella sp.]